MVTNKEDFVYGTRAVIEAIKGGKTIDKVLLKKGLSGEVFKELNNILLQNNIPVQRVPVEKINRITRKNHQGVVALLSPIAFDNIETVLPWIYEKGEDPFLLILDQITDVRNFGAIVRSAEGAGVHAIIIPDKGMARIGADAVKTSAGALHNLPVCKVKSLPESVRFLIDSGIRIIASTEKGTKLYTDSDLKGPLGIIMGSEDRGISGQLLTLAHEQLRIPLKGKIGSLNVSVSAALMIYEALRQRG